VGVGVFSSEAVAYARRHHLHHHPGYSSGVHDPRHSNWHEIRARHANKKDSRWEKIAILLLVPVMGFGYMSLRALPPEYEQIMWTIGFTVVMYNRVEIVREND
jgi:hypothetical protein